MQKICLLLAFVATLGSVFAEEVTKDQGVLVLTDSNFDDELKNHEFIVVEFYAPWCGHCKKLAPEYIKAAEILAKNDPPFYVAKVDATVEKKIAGRFGVGSFPTLFFFKNGQKTDYTGGRTSDTLVSWILKNSGPPSTKVTCPALKKEIDGSKFVIAYFGDESDAMFKDVHVGYANIEDKITFVHSNDAACATEYGASTQGFVFFRKFETTTNVYTGASDTDSLVSFVKPLMVPTVFEFTEDELQAVFGQQQPTAILFRSTETDANAAFMDTWSEAAKTHKGKVLFTYSDVSGGIQKRLAEFMGVTKDSLPTLRIILPVDMKKFESPVKPADLDVEYIGKFIDGVLSGAIKPAGAAAHDEL